MPESSYNSSVIALKPDAIERGLEDQIYGELEDRGFQILGKKEVEVSAEDALRQYSHVREKENGNDILRGICEYLVGNKMEVAVVTHEGEQDVFDALEETIGDSPYPEENDKGTIRGAAVNNPESPFYDEEWLRWYDSRTVGRLEGRGVRNLVHFSDDHEEMMEDAGRYLQEELEELRTKADTAIENLG